MGLEHIAKTGSDHVDEIPLDLACITWFRKMANLLEDHGRKSPPSCGILVVCGGYVKEGCTRLCVGLASPVLNKLGGCVCSGVGH